MDVKCMSKYNSRLYIRVKNNSVWSNLFDMDLEPYSLYVSASELFNTNDIEFILDDPDWSIYEEDLEDFVREIADRLGTDCIVIADTTDTLSEPFDYMVCYFGDEVIAQYAEEEEDSRNSNMFYETEIYEIEKWLSTAVEYGLEISDSDKEYLSDFDIYID